MIVTDANAAAQVFGWMVAGFGTGDWTGHGITSTIAATDPNGLLALGYANNIDLGASQFAGITLGNNDTIVKFTYYGDADLDGVVTLEDFSQFLYGYQQGGTPNWIDGDFDYSGTVTLEDFSLFLANHNTTPATPTYAIDGLDQTFTAGEEVTLSPRITNNIPLPAGINFVWNVLLNGVNFVTGIGTDFSFIASNTGVYDIKLSDGNDHVLDSQTTSVGIPSDYKLVDTLQVPIPTAAGNITIMSSAYLLQGVSYFVEASGTVQIANNPVVRLGDAVSIQHIGDLVWTPNATNLVVSGVSSWGTMRADHVYGAQVTGNGQKLAAHFQDNGSHGDNAGYMTVKIYKAITYAYVYAPDPDASEENASTTSEDNATFRFMLTRSNTTELTTIQFKINNDNLDTATLGTDYTVSGATNSGDVYTCTIPANGTFADVVIHPIDDSAEEGVENLSVTMIEEETIGSSTPAFMVVEEDKKAEAKVNDNEGPSVKLELMNSKDDTIVKAPENEDYEDEKKVADGLDNLGPLPPGSGRTGEENEFTNAALVVGTVSNIPAGAELRRKRLITSRVVSIRYDATLNVWNVKEETGERQRMILALIKQTMRHHRIIITKYTCMTTLH